MKLAAALAFLMPLALLLPTHLAAASCVPATVVDELDTASIGGLTQMTIDALDDSWFVVSTPYGSAGNVPAVSIDDHPAWIQTTGNPVWYANWINPWGSKTPNPLGFPVGSNSPYTPIGTYVYAITFTLTAADLANHPTFTLYLRYAADDIVTFRVNSGPSFGGPGSFATWSSASFTGNSGTAFVAGTNTLYATVTNNLVYTGLLAVGGVQGDC